MGVNMPQPDNVVGKRKREFDAHVWQHATDPRRMAFEKPMPLKAAHVAVVKRLIAISSADRKPSMLSDAIWEEVREDDLLYALLQLSGLTRSKPKSDLELDLRRRGYAYPANISQFLSDKCLWDISLGPYLALRLREVLQPLSQIGDPECEAALEALNVATWAGYIRQELAKRSGGFAEQQVAIFMRDLGIPFSPQEKAVNGLTSDVTFEGESIDLVVPSLENSTILVIAMVHTANIGQFGESKTREILAAVDAAEASELNPYVVPLVDGVGFWGNPGGLKMMLRAADEFFQLETLWKLGVMAAASLGETVELCLRCQKDHDDFLAEFEGWINLVDRPRGRSRGWVESGPQGREAVMRLAP